MPPPCAPDKHEFLVSDLTADPARGQGRIAFRAILFLTRFRHTYNSFLFSILLLPVTCWANPVGIRLSLFSRSSYI